MEKTSIDFRPGFSPSKKRPSPLVQRLPVTSTRSRGAGFGRDWLAVLIFNQFLLVQEAEDLPANPNQAEFKLLRVFGVMPVVRRLGDRLPAIMWGHIQSPQRISAFLW